MTGTLIALADAPGRAAHRDPDVLRWLAAYTSSMVGDSVYYIALSWAAVQQGSPAQAGAVMAVSAVPRALLMLGGGVIADRFGPRRVVIGSDTVRCAAVLAVAALLFLTSPGLWPLALLAVMFGTVDAVFMPAVGALPARVTSRDQLARVQGMRGLAILPHCLKGVGDPHRQRRRRSARRPGCRDRRRGDGVRVRRAADRGVGTAADLRTDAGTARRRQGRRARRHRRYG